MRKLYKYFRKQQQKLKCTVRDSKGSNSYIIYQKKDKGINYFPYKN